MGTTPDPVRPPSVGIERRLAAILSADVQGFSRLMGAEEEATLHTLNAHRKVIDALIQQHRGRIVGTAGDSALAEFASVLDAVRCAVEIQHQLKPRNADLPAHRRMEFRLGINLGDVMVEGEQIYGDGVNVAARLQSLADAGGIFLAGTVYDHIENKLALSYEYLGEQLVKNITKPVRVYRVVLEPGAATAKSRGEVTSPQQTRRVGITHRSWLVVALAGLLLLAGTFLTVRYLSRPPLSIQDSALRTEAAPMALPLPDKPSIVVLPFDNMSKDPEQEYFSNGITEVLTADLSRISSLFVIARNTAFTYKGKATNVQAIGKELGVRYVLEGSVQKTADQVRVVAQLIDTSTGGHLWSERYDRPLKDIFALQDEIVQQIVTTLKLQLSLWEQGMLVRRRTDNLEAYDYFLRGLESYNRLTKEDNVRARQLWEKATALDPQYAEAYAWLGVTYYLEWAWQWNQTPQVLEQGLVMGQKAIALDDTLPAAHELLSWVYVRKHQYDEAIAEGERGIALDPNNADGYALQANVLNFAGRPVEALQAVKQAMRLNPHYPVLYLLQLGWASQLTGQYAESIGAMKNVLLRNPKFLGAYPSLIGGYVQQWSSQLNQDPQTLEQALAAAQRAISVNDSFSVGYMLLGTVHLWQKQYEQALAEMERAVTLAPNDAASYAVLADGLSRVGRAEEALERAEKALDLQSTGALEQHFYFIGSAYYLAGRAEEARPLLARFLSHYPNFLNVHLQLAAVYSELGQEAEARAEAAEVLRLNPQFSLEVHRQRMPIKDPAVLERHLAALRKAGLK